MTTPYTIVTAWFDVREKENNPLKDVENNGEFCTVNHYMKSIKLLFEKDFPLVIFTEPKYEKKMWDTRPSYLHYKTRVIVKQVEDLNMQNLFDKFIEGHELHPIHNLHKEKFTGLYKFIVNQKTEFVKDVIMMNPFDSEKFAWMDLRLHDVYDMSIEETNQVFAGFDSNHVTITQCRYTHSQEVTNRNDFYSNTRGRVCAGFFAGTKGPLLEFCKLCHNEFVSSVEKGLAPSDEMIYASIVAECKELFHPHVGDYSDVLRNLPYIKKNADWAMAFLQATFDNGKHSWTYKLAEKIRLGIVNKAIHLSYQDTYKVWYYNYVANYWLGNREHCKEILDEFYVLLKDNKELACHLKSVYLHFRENIIYLNNTEMVNKFDEFVNSF